MSLRLADYWVRCVVLVHDLCLTNESNNNDNIDNNHNDNNNNNNNNNDSNNNNNNNNNNIALYLTAHADTLQHFSGDFG